MEKVNFKERRTRKDIPIFGLEKLPDEVIISSLKQKNGALLAHISELEYNLSMSKKIKGYFVGLKTLDANYENAEKQISRLNEELEYFRTFVGTKDQKKAESKMPSIKSKIKHFKQVIQNYNKYSEYEILRKIVIDKLGLEFIIEFDEHLDQIQNKGAYQSLQTTKTPLSN